ncbi:MAG: uroporphyrinogen decarboxylase family protein [Chloroflexota bacterium]
MNHQERLDHAIAGHAIDRVPVSLWRRFPGDDQRIADFAQSITAYQHQFDWDFVNVTPASTYNVNDYGLQTAWQGRPDGDRTVTRPYIVGSLDWTELRGLDPAHGEHGKQLEVLRSLRAELDEHTPIIMTIYSPLTQASRLAGESALLRHMRTRMDRLRSGLSVLTENTLRFTEALKKTPIAGICYMIEHADHEKIAEAEYSIFGLPYDRKILSELAADWWLNVLHISGKSPMFSLVSNYSVQAVNWQATDERPTLPRGKSQILGAACGGLTTHDDLCNSTPAAIRSAARSRLQQVNNRRVILSAEGMVPITAPLSNVRAARAAVEAT